MALAGGLSWTTSHENPAPGGLQTRPAYAADLWDKILIYSQASACLAHRPEARKAALLQIQAFAYDLWRSNLGNFAKIVIFAIFFEIMQNQDRTDKDTDGQVHASICPTRYMGFTQPSP
ncbi:hypothetical protein ACERNI_01440 [Camelimonas sp. ID_303_24]